jgi:hypothetical protein
MIYLDPNSPTNATGAKSSFLDFTAIKDALVGVRPGSGRSRNSASSSSLENITQIWVEPSLTRELVFVPEKTPGSSPSQPKSAELEL